MEALPIHSLADPMDATTAPHAAPWDKISISLPASWVEKEDYDATPSGRAGDHVTQLLWSRQIRIGTGQSFHATARRLETSLAVQHESQWSVQLDPRTQTISLHWLRIVRGDQRIDQLRRDRLRLIQRETKLEHLIIDGVWTLILVLDDVRPGDILEAAFSYETRHPIRPGATEDLFFVPPGVVVGRYRFSAVSHSAAPRLNWKASADAPVLKEEHLPDGCLRWTWEGTQQTARPPEPNQPATSMDCTWVQVSDLVQWPELSARVAAIWTLHGNDDGLAADPAFARPESVDADSVNRLIQHIQDEFRYLSLDLELGGWIPAAPGNVARRRYGDCKDLVWLAATVLRAWGLSARPILVGSGLRERVESLLPMTSLFNHVVLEVTVANQTRWFDLTERQQGGDFAGRSVGWFGFGLPVDINSDGLRAQPGERTSGVYALRETILLDSRQGAGSVVEQRIWTEGWQADRLRFSRQSQGEAAFAEDREQQAQRRYGKARRTGTLQWRDDRTRNTCEIVEVFEVAGVYTDGKDPRALFDVPPNIVLQCIPVPDDKPRRTAWALPFPLELRHEITVKAASMAAGNRRIRRWSESGFSAVLDEPRLKGAWTRTAHFKVSAPSVPPDQLDAHRKQLEKFVRETGWRIHLPWGHPRVRRGPGFGELAESRTERAACVAPVHHDTVRTSPSLTTDDFKQDSQSRRRRHRRSFQSSSHFTMPSWAWRMAWFFFVLVTINAFRACSGHSSGY